MSLIEEPTDGRGGAVGDTQRLPAPLRRDSTDEQAQCPFHKVGFAVRRRGRTNEGALDPVLAAAACCQPWDSSPLDTRCGFSARSMWCRWRYPWPGEVIHAHRTVRADGVSVLARAGSTRDRWGRGCHLSRVRWGRGPTGPGCGL